MKYLNKTVIIIAAAISLFACNTDNFVHTKAIDIPGETWKWDNPITFEYEITDSNTTYNHLFQIRLTDKYAKANIYFTRKMINPNGDTLPETLFNCQLFTEEGAVIGKKSGRFFNVETLLEKNLKTNVLGKYKVILTQHTREFELHGVNAVGYAVTKGEPVF